ncbi:MAG: flagellar hook-length control protein FliK [Janthinobacterium lividum]
MPIGTAPAIAASPVLPVPVAAPLQPALPAAGAAGRVFAAAIHAAAVPARAQSATDEQDPMVAAMLAGSAVGGVVAPVAAGSSGPLDLGHPGWPTQMAERIEALRDAADATSTSIRISPDALGPVDLQVRRDGDRVHVHFEAANPATRAMIADAQPQLAAAAADRGLKLGQTSVGGGGLSGGGRQPDGQTGDGASARQRTPAPATRNPARSTAAASAVAGSETRIA